MIMYAECFQRDEKKKMEIDYIIGDVSADSTSTE